MGSEIRNIGRIQRNPIFVAMLAALVGFTLLLPNWISLALLVGAGLGIRRHVRDEEAYLARTYGEEYVRYEGERTVHTNTIEGYFSIFKRGMRGIYQHCDEKHLHRYLAEFDFRYNNRIRLGVHDSERTEKAQVRAGRGPVSLPSRSSTANELLTEPGLRA